MSHTTAPRTPPAPTATAHDTTLATPQAEAAPAAVTPIGVGIDTARYGHHATFLRPDLQPAAKPLDFTETAQGYEQFRQRLQAIAQRHGPVHFHIRLDAAGQYADNLLAFLYTLPEPKTISCGDTRRNQNYRDAIFGAKKSDPVESHAMARYALTEKPRATPPLAAELRLLRTLAGRLEAQVRQGTRLVNQLHQLLARTFPELALLVKDISTGWVLEVLDRYPTAAKVAGARPASFETIPYLPQEKSAALQQQARASVASLSGPVIEELVRDQVRQLRDACARKQRLETWLVQAYHALPEDNHLATIKGIGDVTAAVLTAQILDIDRFATPGQLVGYFGVFPSEASSGCERDGQRRKPRRLVLSPRGNDLVRRYLWMAALSAAQHNPAVRPL
jgi:transposase